MTSTAVETVDFPGACAIRPGEARSDRRGRVIVDHAIARQGSSSTMSAFEYLRSRGIGAAVIERVLFDSLRRRSDR
jgi:hypothetical protein